MKNQVNQTKRAALYPRVSTLDKGHDRTPTGELIVHVMASLSQFESSLISISSGVAYGTVYNYMAKKDSFPNLRMKPTIFNSSANVDYYW